MMSATGSEHMRPRHAFTLIELSIAVFILALVVAVAMPAFVRSYNSQLLAETARTFATTCQLARVQAVTQQRKATLHMDLERQVFWVTQTAMVGEGEEGDEQTLKVYELPKRVTIVSAERVDESDRQGRLVEATFYPNGTCDSLTVVFRGVERGGLGATLDPITCQAIPYPVR